MQQNKTASQGKTINPIYWVPTAYFAMGLPFIAINLVSVFMFKDLGISDTQITFWTYHDALDTQILMEPFS